MSNKSEEHALLLAAGEVPLGKTQTKFEVKTNGKVIVIESKKPGAWLGGGDIHTLATYDTLQELDDLACAIADFRKKAWEAIHKKSIKE